MKLSIVTLSIGALLGAGASSALAAKPVDDNGVPFGNGAPSGEHFNLVLLGKKDHFQCQPPEFDEFGHLLVERSQQLWEPLNERHHHPTPMKLLDDFQADIAAADNRRIPTPSPLDVADDAIHVVQRP